MKKKIAAIAGAVSFLATGTIFAASSALSGVFAKQYVYVFNGQQKPMTGDYQTLEYKDRAYVPVRFVSEALGLKVQYDQRGQLINISLPETLKGEEQVCPYITTNDKIRALEEKVAKLEKENSELKTKIKDLNGSIQKEVADKGITSHSYDVLPSSNLDDNLKITVKGYGFENGDQDLYLNVRLENVNDSNGSFQLSPSDTMLSLNGKEYKAYIDDSGLSLYNMLSKKEDHVDGSLIFKGVSRDNEKEGYLIRFVYTDSSGSGKRTVLMKFKLK